MKKDDFIDAITEFAVTGDYFDLKKKLESYGVEPAADEMWNIHEEDYVSYCNRTGRFLNFDQLLYTEMPQPVNAINRRPDEQKRMDCLGF